MYMYIYIYTIIKHHILKHQLKMCVADPQRIGYEHYVYTYTLYTYMYM